MIKLALLGKDIQHSLSPSIYKGIFGPNLSYDLLDYSSTNEIPSLEKLFQTYSGINITSPYKKHFIDQVQLTTNARKLGAINCLKRESGKIVGENTDYLAILDILNQWKRTFTNLEVALLGDGVMSQVTEAALKHLAIPYKVYSRKLTPHFHQLNFQQLYPDSQAQLIVINTCSRDFVFQGLLPKSTLFWDYNYQFTPHHYLKMNIQTYVDGKELLELQAKYAVAFWSFNLELFK